MRSLGIILLLVALVLAGLGYGVMRFGGSESRRADLLAVPPGDGSLREILTVAPGPELTSPQGKRSCVAYRTRVIHHLEWPDESRDEVLFEETRGPQAIELRGPQGSYYLPRKLWSEPRPDQQERLSEPPPWLPPTSLGEAPKMEFRVEETCLVAGQSLFVAATPGPGQRLMADPELEGVVVFPGSQQDCVLYYRQHSAYQQRAGQVFVGLGALVGLVALVLARRPDRTGGGP